ncbi:MAG TPA: flagellar filament capping protein FliD [Acidobacteriaceae bacterium]|jgi:flagellar hook-associated protein 2|nr:flagellar filament capping protein FliD [Acidobacteriaceae bacterium]
MSSTISALNSLLSNSSSAYDLSSILEAALGATSPGIDVNQAVSASLSAAEAPEQQWETQESILQSQESALTQIQTGASNLDTDMQSLNSVTGPLAATTVTSSNSSVVTATSASGSASGNNVVIVKSLATNDSWSSSTLASASTTVPAGSFTITPGDGDATTITTDGTQTLSDLASQINGDSLGLSANVITDSSGSRLSIVSNTSGSASDFTVTTSGYTGFGFTEVEAGADASLTVNGNQISSASNTVTGVVPGLTLNLLGTSSSPVTLSVAPDTSQASTAIERFVSDYNTLISAVNTQFSYTDGVGEGVLSDDPTVRTLQSDLLQSIDYTYTPASGTTTMPNLSSMGITMNSDGTLSVDSATLDNALKNNYSDVQQFFQGASLNGFANSMDQQLTSFTSPGDGAFTVDLQSMSSEYTSLQSDIANFQTNVIEPLQTRLQAQYSQAEVALQQLPIEMRNVDAELGINSGASNG